MKRPYGPKLDPDRQITSEERIQAVIVNNTTASEDVAAKLARHILYLTLREYRRDLFVRRHKDCVKHQPDVDGGPCGAQCVTRKPGG